jgi:predicted dinucleotide-binding enzyme
MTTAVIGLGRIGAPLAQELASGGEPVILANRGRPKANALAKRIGPLARVASVEEAIAGADVVIFAVTFELIKKMAVQFRDLLKGKIVVDPSNPVAPDERRRLIRVLPEGQSSGSVIAGLLPAGARFVKAFGTLSAESLAAAARRRSERAVLFYATDDAGAGQVIERLIMTAGFVPARVGGVKDSLRIEVGGILHQFGGLNGQVPGVAKARAALKNSAEVSNKRQDERQDRSCEEHQ